MKTLTADDLRALIRLIPMTRALQNELDKSVPLETYEGTASLAVRSFVGLQQSVYALTEDPYVGALSINVEDGMTERHLISQVILAVSQLNAYIESQTGVAGLTAPREQNIHTAPTITLSMDSFRGGPEETERIMRTLDRAIQFRPIPPVPPTPPVPPAPPGFPPAPPAPPRAPRSPFGRHPYGEDEEV